MRCVGVAMYTKRAVNLRVLRSLSSKGGGSCMGSHAPLLHPPVLNQLLYRHPDGIFFATHGMPPMRKSKTNRQMLCARRYECLGTRLYLPLFLSSLSPSHNMTTPEFLVVFQKVYPPVPLVNCIAGLPLHLVVVQV